MTQEEISIKYVMKYEKAQGRKPIDMSKKRIGYDIKSGNRFIEVKSRPRPNLFAFITLQDTLLRRLGKGIAHYYIYVVFDMDGSPKIVIIPPDTIFKNLKTAVKLYIPAKVYNKIKPIKIKKNKFQISK